MRRIATVILTVLVFVSIIGCGGTTTHGSSIVLPPPTQPPIGNMLYGVDFGPFLTGNPETGSVVSKTDIQKYIAACIAPNFKWIRPYSMSAGLENVPAIAKSYGLKVAAASWISNDLKANTAEINALIASCNANLVDVAVVGSEVLRRGQLTDAQMIGYINQVKATGVKVTTSDTWSMLVAHPSVIAACDEVWANFYPFWEGASIDQAMALLQADYNRLKSVAGGKRIVIAETGWPSEGDQNLSAVASPQNAAKYFVDFITWANTQKVDYFYFEAFDEGWKTSRKPIGPHWGIWDANLSLKAGMNGGFLASSLTPQPHISITSPADGSHQLSPLTLQVQFSDRVPGDFEQVSFTIDGVSADYRIHVPQGTLSFDPVALKAGTHQIKVTVLHQGVSASAQIAIVIDPPNNGIPAIDFTVEQGANRVVGTSVNIDPTKYVISLYLFVPNAGGWWTKPQFDSPTVEIRLDGVWDGAIVTGGIDNTGTKVAAFAILKTYSPPALGGSASLPQEIYDTSVAHLIVDRVP